MGIEDLDFTKKKVVTLQDHLAESISDCNSIVEECGDVDRTTRNRFTRGINDFPKWVGTFDKGDLMVLAGYPSTGKTEFTYFIAKKNADIGTKVLYISLELPPQMMYLRLARKKAGISKQDRQNKNFSEQQRDIANTRFNKYKNYNNLKVI